MRRTLTILTVLLAGCQVSPLARLAPPVGSGIAPVAAVAAAARTGVLAFTVKWPTRDYEGFRAQAIPLSTNALKLEIQDAQGQLVATELLQRASGSLPVTRSLMLREGTGYTATVKAYAETAPTEASVVLAQGTAANLEVVWGKQVPVHLTLAPVFAPAITALSRANGARGQTLEITGTNLGLGVSPSVVFPSGLQASASYADGKLSLLVPDGAGSGNLAVKVDGITSSSNALFREIRSLGLGATASFDRLESDGALHTWLGDTMTLEGSGYEGSGSLIPSPSLDSYSHTQASLANLVDRAYTPIGLGDDQVQVSAGGLTATRSVVISPMAGAVLKASSASAVVSDVAVCAVGSRFLVAWYVAADNKVYWRFVNADGTLDATVYNTTSSGVGDERMVRVAYNGTSLSMAYRAGGVVNGVAHNLVFFAELDPTTGAMMTTPGGAPRYWNINPQATGNAYYLNDLTAVGDHFALTFTRWDGTVYDRKLYTYRFDGNGDLVGNLVYGWGNATFQVAPYRDDHAAVVASGSQLVLAQHFTVNGQVSTQLFLSNADGSTISSMGYSHNNARNLSIASDGNEYLLVEIEAGAETSLLKAYRYNAALGQINTEGIVLADLGMLSPGAINYPVRLVWDGTRYLVSYTRKYATTVNGIVKLVAQPMIQQVGTNGQPVGSAYPVATSGNTSLIAPSAEGGYAVWLSTDKEAIVRRIKVR